MLAATQNFGSAFYEEIGALVVVALLIWRKVWPALKRLMERRAETIRTQLAAGEEARRAAEELLVTRRSELEVARQEAAHIVEQARSSAEQIVLDGQRRAVSERERLIARAGVEIEQLASRAREEVASEMALLVVEGAQRIIEAELDEGMHRRLVGETIAAAESEAT